MGGGMVDRGSWRLNCVKCLQTRNFPPPVLRKSVGIRLCVCANGDFCNDDVASSSLGPTVGSKTAVVRDDGGGAATVDATVTGLLAAVLFQTVVRMQMMNAF
jgi:hypothetical protein